jgi:hypothetical protein
MKRNIPLILALASLGGCIITDTGIVSDQGPDAVSITRPDLITRVSGQSASADAGERAVAFARCPVGYVALSGGHGFTTEGGENLDDADFYVWSSTAWRVPGSSGPYDSWRVEAVLDAELESWQLRVTATCYRWQPDESDIDFADVDLPEL